MTATDAGGWVEAEMESWTRERLEAEFLSSRRDNHDLREGLNLLLLTARLAVATGDIGEVGRGLDAYLGRAV